MELRRFFKALAPSIVNWHCYCSMIFCVLNWCFPCCDPEPPADLPPDEPPCSVYDECNDHDCMSYNTETNSTNAYLGLDPNTTDANPTGSGGTYDSGSLTNALNLKDEGEGYYHYYGTDLCPPCDGDDWGTMALLFVLEATGKRFQLDYPGKRYGVGDLSLQYGGYWSDHHNHQNGCEADIRYLRGDFQEVPLHLDSGDSVSYDLGKTSDLINCFYEVSLQELCSSPASLIIVSDLAHINITPGFEWLIHKDDTGEHDDHMHFQIQKP